MTLVYSIRCANDDDYVLARGNIMEFQEEDP